MSTECTSPEKPRILAFEAWDAGSHRGVREAIVRHASCHWRWCTLPRGNWRWRLRLGAVDLAANAAEVGVLDEPWDVVFATSMVSLADLIASLPPSIAARPRILYMHENQAAYPAAKGRSDPRDAHAAVTNLTSMLTADLVLWNSCWNLESFLVAMDELLSRGGHAVEADVLAEVKAKSRIAWPPVERPQGSDREVLHNAAEARARGLTLAVWPHRWEHDKGPAELLAIEQQYGESARIGWVLLGEQFEQRPAEFSALLKHAGDRVIHSGTAPRAIYESWLQECDWVASTANHEFFGVAVVEAMLAGCLPWLPNRLSYPELVPAGCIGLSPMEPPSDPTATRNAIQKHLRAAEAAAAVEHIESAIDECRTRCSSG